MLKRNLGIATTNNNQQHQPTTPMHTMSGKRTHKQAITDCMGAIAALAGRCRVGRRPSFWAGGLGPRGGNSMDTTNVKRNGLLRHAATLLAVLVLAQVGGGPMFVKGAEAKPSGPVALGPRLAERHGLGVFGPGGNVLAAIAADGAVTLRDAVTGQTQWAHADAVNGRVTGLAFSPDGKVLASFGAVSASL